MNNLIYGFLEKISGVFFLGYEKDPFFQGDKIGTCALQTRVFNKN